MALDRQRVRRCMGSLSTLQAEAIKLAYYSGYSYPEVAGLLGLPLGTVKTRIRDGLIRMRDCMGVPSERPEPRPPPADRRLRGRRADG